MEEMKDGGLPDWTEHVEMLHRQLFPGHSKKTLGLYEEHISVG